jgi:DNA invertase Pin-like site-specific DNA recombinase
VEREQHSAGWDSYIEKVQEHEWKVVFRTVDRGTRPTREEARILIRALKQDEMEGLLKKKLDRRSRFTRILSRLEVEEAAGRSSERV